MSNSEIEQIREALNPLYLEAGAALYDCQQFEYSIALLMLQLSRIKVPGLDKAKARAILDGNSKTTAGQLLKMLRSHAPLGNDIESILDRGLADRNHIIHKFLVKNVRRMLSPSERTNLLSELQALRGNVQRAIKAIDPILSFFMKKLDKMEYDEERIGDLFTFVESKEPNDGHDAK